MFLAVSEAMFVVLERSDFSFLCLPFLCGHCIVKVYIQLKHVSEINIHL